MKLGDPVVDRLIDHALAENPTIGEALARVDQARASLDGSNAARLPRADVSGSATYGQQSSGTPGGAETVSTTTVTISPSLSWEIDLWGRVRHTARAAQSRLDARTADAGAARLSVTTQIASGVLRLRACNYSLGIRDEDIASRRTELELMQIRLSFGNVAPVEVVTARSNLASAETDRISQRETCMREVDSLVAISGIDAPTIRSLLPEPRPPGGDASPRSSAGAEGNMRTVIPAAPSIEPVLPATVLLNHPSVVAAGREADARWSEIGVAKAERMPKIDLVAILTSQWIRAMGTTTSLVTWSAGPQLSGTLFDGGAGAANVRNAQARYREAAAILRGAVRTAVREIEDGLAAKQSAEQRIVTSREAVAAARFTLTANQARRRAGSISQFELEESRRQFNRALESAIAAERDNSAAWVELIRASGNAFDIDDATPAGGSPPSAGSASGSQPQ
jgi:NodT family efflux transporter outer membrane factor (OMF) lipoprotein